MRRAAVLEAIASGWSRRQRARHADADLIRLGLFVLVALLAAMTLSPRHFFSAANFESMAFTLPELGLLSLAMMLAMFSGGIDLSVVAIANLSGILAAQILVRSGAFPLAATLGAACLGLAGGAMAGAFNGLLISSLRIPPILATLGSMQLLTGLATVLTGGAAVYGFPEPFLALGNETLLGIPIPFLIFAAVAVAVAILLGHTTFGLRLRLVGSSRSVAFYSGLRLEKVLFSSYVVGGLLAGMTGLLMAARAASAKADYGTSYLLQAILLVVLGGVRPSGGVGRVPGVLLALAALQIVASLFNVLRLGNFAKEFAWGLLLLVVMITNTVLDRRAARRPATTSVTNAQNKEKTP
ncbi:MAG: ABC transporter permease [Deltaproteobacteria bacterium]|nr:ABC transporter permease [Deltaproteobacteria bacterium]